MTTGNFLNLNASHFTIGWFADQNAQGRLLLRPPFQRRPVWTQEEKAFLVDTILRNYPVPEVYTFLVSDDDQGDTYALVDGQQRLRACLEFLVDGFPVTFDVHKLEPLYSLADTPWYNKKFSDLSREEKDRFRRYKLVVRDLEGVDEIQIRHMFQRLNQSNVMLNEQELRYSMYEGGLLKLVEKLVERDEWAHFRLFTKLQRRRMLDSEFIGELVIGYLHWPQNKKDSVDHYYRQYAQDFPFSDEVNTRFDEVLRFLVELFPNPRMSGTRWYRKSDFYTLFLAIARGQIAMHEWDLEQLRLRLVQFSNDVSSNLYDDESPVAVYKGAVERAATDRARRVRREEALIAYLVGDTAVRTDVDDVFSPDEDADDSEADDDEYMDADPDLRN